MNMLHREGGNIYILLEVGGLLLLSLLLLLISYLKFHVKPDLRTESSKTEGILEVIFLRHFRLDFTFLKTRK